MSASLWILNLVVLAAVGVGILLGLVASALMRVSVNLDGSAGVPYAVVCCTLVGLPAGRCQQRLRQGRLR